ncbi:MAG: class I SAM-dependent methyltransferase [Alphaproteobacteria bacterium]|nr:class I SAM-dependent methyltransferase [Alphaproteobacteria bacterium]
MIYRLTNRPTQQYLFFLLQRDGALSKGREIGLDLGCNRMQNRPVFHTGRYVGVDVDAVALRNGQSKYPEAEAIHARIEAGEQFPDGDFVVCVQVFAKHFVFDKAVPALVQVCNKVRKGGVLLINFGTKNMEQIPELRAVLAERFAAVEEVPYGISQKTTYFAPLIAAFDFFTRARPRAVQKVYFRAVGRR